MRAAKATKTCRKTWISFLTRIDELSRLSTKELKERRAELVAQIEAIEIAKEPGNSRILRPDAWDSAEHKLQLIMERNDIDKLLNGENIDLSTDLGLRTKLFGFYSPFPLKNRNSHPMLTSPLDEYGR